MTEFEAIPVHQRTIALVGLMGVGKSTVGRRLAKRLNLPFADGDVEIEAAAGMTVSDIFAQLGEAEFRAGEARVMRRLLEGPRMVLATGGGAMLNLETRALMKARAVTVWMRADLETVALRVQRRDTRPLLRGRDPLEALTTLAEARYPVYGAADVTVDVAGGAHAQAVDAIVEALEAYGATGGAGVTTTIPVSGGDFRPYDVVVGRGLLSTLGARMAPMARGRTAVVTDETVAGIHGPDVLASLAAAGVRARLLTVPPGEGSKSFAELERVLDRLLAFGLDRNDVVVALGGGVVGDLAGLAAALYMRGIDFVQVPTTLLAQVDSSVGGKTAIDTPRGKNLVGAFHQPRLVLADIDLLATLPERQLRSGWAEVLKHGLICDADFFDWLAGPGAAGATGDATALERAVVRSVEIKSAIVGEDEKEAGRRALLNLGHTFGHAIEAELDFDGAKMTHGEAVALGCALAFRFSAAAGLCAADEAERVGAVIAAAGLPVRLDQAGAFTADRLLKRMAGDKKAEGGRLTLILARRIGEAFTARDVDRAAVGAFLRTEGAA